MILAKVTGVDNIFANKVLQYNDVKADGGIAASGMRANPAGDGTITVNELGAVLNYPEKEITLEIGKSYGIENSKLSYTELNDIQTENLSVGSIKYEPIDGSGIISINSTGVVTGEIAGKTKVKIIDEHDVKRSSLSKFKEYLDIENPQRICFICGKHIDNPELSIDHVIPWSYLYSDDLWNLVYVHKSCNSSKSNIIPLKEDIQKLKDRNKRLLQKLEEKDVNSKIVNELDLSIQKDYVNKFWIGCKS